MERANFIKLSEMDGKVFTITAVGKYQYKFWDNANRKMLISDKYEKDYRKVYSVTTDQGIMDISQRQMKDMLESVVSGGVADINNKSFEVKKVVGQNDIPNYFFNAIRTEKKKEEAPLVSDDELDEPLDMSQIPF